MIPIQTVDSFAVVLFDRTDCQRVSARVSGDAVLISKDWRKDINEPWRIGKGVMLQRDDIRNLNDLINCTTDEELQELLGDYETLQESFTYDEETGRIKPSTNSARK